VVDRNQNQTSVICVTQSTAGMGKPESNYRLDYFQAPQYRNCDSVMEGENRSRECGVQVPASNFRNWSSIVEVYFRYPGSRKPIPPLRF